MQHLFVLFNYFILCPPPLAVSSLTAKEQSVFPLILLFSESFFGFTNWEWNREDGFNEILPMKNYTSFSIPFPSAPDIILKWASYYNKLATIR